MPAQLISDGISALGLAVTEQQSSLFCQYLDLLEKWNSKFNLTSIRDKHQMVPLHLLDSLSIVPFIEGDRVLDVGTGAGLPGIPLAIMFPHKNFILLDSNGKKIRFCRQAIFELGLDNVTAEQQRIESYQPDVLPDVITSRAFTSLVQMVKLLQALLGASSRLMAMKGQLPVEEIDQLVSMGFEVKVHALSIPGQNLSRHLVEISTN